MSYITPAKSCTPRPFRNAASGVASTAAKRALRPYTLYLAVDADGNAHRGLANWLRDNDLSASVDADGLDADALLLGHVTSVASRDACVNRIGL
jgi:hypothetical protein